MTATKSAYAIRFRCLLPQSMWAKYHCWQETTAHRWENIRYSNHLIMQMKMMGMKERGKSPHVRRRCTVVKSISWAKLTLEQNMHINNNKNPLFAAYFRAHFSSLFFSSAFALRLCPCGCDDVLQMCDVFSFSLLFSCGEATTTKYGFTTLLLDSRSRMANANKN